MLGYESERRLKNMLVLLCQGERDIEQARQRLCLIADFALHSAFQRVDRKCQANISSHEIVDFLRDNACYHVAESEAFQLLQFFDCNGNNRLSHQEFIQMFLPCEDNILRNVTLDRPSRRVGKFDKLPRDIELAMTAVIEKEVDFARKLEILKKELQTQYDYSPLASFRSVDKYNSGIIDTVNLGQFLRQHGHFANELDLLAIIRRIDTNGTATIDFQEWAEYNKLLQPVHTLNPDPIPAARPRSYAGGTGRRPGSPLRQRSPGPGPSRHIVNVEKVTVPGKEVTYETTYDPVSAGAYTKAYGSMPPFPEPRHGAWTPQRISPTRKPILRVQDEDHLVHALREACVLEQELEDHKILLSQKQDFNLFDAFNIFDIERRGAISVTELQVGLNAIGVYPTFDECQLLMARYDKSRDGRLSFLEFQQMLLPLDAYYSSMVQRRGTNYVPRLVNRLDIFVPHTQAEFQSIWKTHLRVENASEAMRQSLNANPAFNAYEAFNCLDLNDSGSVTAAEMQRMLETRGFFVGVRAAEVLIGKFDKKGNGRVTFEEFQEETRQRSPIRR